MPGVDASSIKQAYEFLTKLPSKRITIPAAALLAGFWSSVWWLPNGPSWRDAVVATFLVVGLCGFLDILTYKSRGLSVYLFRRVFNKTLSIWQESLAAVIFYLVVIAASGLLTWSFYFPPGYTIPQLLVTDISDRNGRHIGSALSDTLARRLADDSCKLNTQVTFIATPLAFRFRERWILKILQKMSSGVAVYGEPAQQSERICSRWTASEEDVKFYHPWGLRTTIWAEYPGSGRDIKTAFEKPYCSNGIDDASVEDTIDEVTWKVHVLAALKAHKEGAPPEVTLFIATHGAQETRANRTFRAIVSSMIAGMIAHDAAANYAATNSCAAADWYGQSVTQFAQAIRLNREVEVNRAKQASKEAPGWELYNHLNMSQVQLLNMSALTEGEEARKKCVAKP